MSSPVVVTVYLITLVSCCTTGKSIHPCQCKIDMKICSADCSNLGLTNISSVINCVPKTTRELVLSNNNLHYVRPGILNKFAYLKTLRLDFNNIGHLTSGTFDGLAMLQNLSLDHNNLSYNDSYADDIFAPLQNLHYLYLQNNCNVHTTRCAHPDKALSVATSLQYLQLDGFPDFGPGFARLKNLNSLLMSSNDGYCNFQILTEATFKPFRQTPLSYLQLARCDIKNVEPNVFRGLRNLTTLIVVDNKRLCSDSIDNATIGLNETNVETITFNHWCRVRATYISLTKGMLRGLTNTSLKRLDLGYNFINYVDPTCIDNLPKSLNYLSFKENKIDDANCVERLKHLDNLETLDISYQYHYDAGRPKWTNTGELVLKLNTSLNLLRTVTTSSDNKLVYLPKNIRTIYMNNIKLMYPLPSLTFGPNKLQYLNTSSCMFTAFLGTWYGLKDLQYFDLSSNSLSAFSNNSLIDMGNLTTLLLQNNQIGDALYLDIEAQTFSSQKKLEVLDLSNNAIKYLPYNIFKNQVNVRNLSLADNAMKNVSFALKAMAKIQYLDFSGNEIEYISIENMDFLDHVAATEYFQLDLSGNILSCICDNQQFVSWLATTKVNIINKNKLTCLYLNGTVVSLSMIDVIKTQLNYDCMSLIVIMSCVVGFICLLFVFSLVALVYHKRWQLRYLWYIGRIKIDPYNPPGDQQTPPPEIDAYISYEQHYDVKDEVTLHQMIEEKLYPFFEGRYTLKIREEFQGNDILYRVIPETVRKSRKVIVFLTPSYCKDYWNIFEFNIAAYEGIYTKRSVIIPVLLGELSETHLTPEIRSFVCSKIKSNEVLRFPSPDNYERDINAFNEQLEQRLRQ